MCLETRWLGQKKWFLRGSDLAGHRYSFDELMGHLLDDFHLAASLDVYLLWRLHGNGHFFDQLKQHGAVHHHLFVPRVPRRASLGADGAGHSLQTGHSGPNVS